MSCKMNPSAKFFDFISDKIITYPKLVLTLVLAFTVFLGVGITQLKIEGAIGNIFNPKSSYVTDFSELLNNFENLEREIIIMVEADDILAKTTRNEISNLHLQLEFLDSIESVISIASLRDSPTNPNNIGQLMAGGNFDKYGRDVILQKLHNHPIAKQRLISKDGREAMLIITLKSHDTHNTTLEAVNKQADLLARQELKTSKYYFTGFLAVSSQIVSAILNDQITFVIGGALLGLLFGYLFFKHTALVMATAIPSVLSIFWTLGAMGWAGISVNVMTNVVPTIILVIAFADAMHIVDAIRRHLKLGETPKAAIAYAIKTVGPACAFTTITTSIAFFSLSFANTPIIAEFGRAAAMGTFLALLASLVLSGLICLLFVRYIPIKVEPELAYTNGIVHHKMVKISQFFGNLSVKHAKKIVAFGVFLLLVSGLIHFQNSPEYRYSENLPQDNPATYAIGVIDEKLGGINSLYYIVSRKDKQPLDFANPDVIQLLTQIDGLIESEKTYKSSLSIFMLRDWLSYGDNKLSLNEVLNKLPKKFTKRFITDDKKSIITTAFTGDIGARALRPFLRDMRVGIQKILVGKSDEYRIVLTGLAAMSAEESSEMIGELNYGLLIAMGIIIVLMGVVFKSSFYAFASILPNLLPIVAGGALLYFIADGLQFTSVIALTIAFGIAVDDSIHFLYQYKQNKKKYETSEAIDRTLKQVGPVLIATTFMLSAGLGLLFFSDLPQMSLFGIVVIFILNVALLADIAILPSIFYIKDKIKNENKL